VRRSLDLRSWEAASELVPGGEASGQIGVVKPEVPTVSDAVSKFLHDLEHGQKRPTATISKHKSLLEKRLLPWCEEEGFRLLKQLDVTTLRAFRSGWPDSPVTAQKNLERCDRFSGSVTAPAGWRRIRPRPSSRRRLASRQNA
jgi:hypothetical protein